MPVPWTSDCSAPRRSNGLNMIFNGTRVRITGNDIRARVGDRQFPGGPASVIRIGAHDEDVRGRSGAQRARRWWSRVWRVDSPYTTERRKLTELASAKYRVGTGTSAIRNPARTT
jgi:hypothetical protein